MTGAVTGAGEAGTGATGATGAGAAATGGATAAGGGVTSAPVTTAHPPKGPAFASLRQRTMHASPLGPPVQAVPGAAWATRGKAVALARLRLFCPGTFVMIVIGTKLVPVASVEIAHVYGPAPSPLT